MDLRSIEVRPKHAYLLLETTVQMASRFVREMMTGEQLKLAADLKHEGRTNNISAEDVFEAGSSWRRSGNVTYRVREQILLG
jgi:hypothetical protein